MADRDELIDFQPVKISDITLPKSVQKEKKNHPTQRLKSSKVLAKLIKAQGSPEVDLDKRYADLLEKFDSRQMG